jgi:hypothetical protein
MAQCQLAVKNLSGYSTHVVVKPPRETISLHGLNHCMGKDLPLLLCSRADLSAIDPLL